MRKPQVCDELRSNSIILSRDLHGGNGTQGNRRIFSTKWKPLSLPRGFPCDPKKGSGFAYGEKIFQQVRIYSLRIEGQEKVIVDLFVAIAPRFRLDSPWLLSPKLRSAQDDILYVIFKKRHRETGLRGRRVLPFFLRVLASKFIGTEGPMNFYDRRKIKTIGYPQGIVRSSQIIPKAQNVKSFWGV